MERYEQRIECRELDRISRIDTPFKVIKIGSAFTWGEAHYVHIKISGEESVKISYSSMETTKWSDGENFTENVNKLVNPVNLDITWCYLWEQKKGEEA